MEKLFVLAVAIFIVVVGEIAVADAISAAGVTGLAALLLSAALPGAFVYYLLTHADQI